MRARPRQRIAAYAVLTDEGGRVLLTRHPGGGRMRLHWVLPGGGVEHGEHGEHPVQALEREVLEETGLRARAGSLQQVLSDITTVGRRRRRLHTVRLIYAAALLDGPGTAVPPAQAGWLTAAQWQDASLAPFTERVLRHLHQ